MEVPVRICFEINQNRKYPEFAVFGKRGMKNNKFRAFPPPSRADQDFYFIFTNFYIERNRAINDRYAYI
jgi:hypothetical protein